MIALTRVDKLLLAALEGGGVITSLFRFAIDEGLDYASAHKRIKRLEAAGLVAIERQRGRPLQIRRAASDFPEMGG